MTPTITWVGMTRQHFQPERPGRVRAIVLHATAGHEPSDLAWLRKGGDPRRPVSAHYYIDKAGHVSQLVRDQDIAWHAGRSRWPVDGRVVDGLNPVSIGIELSNLNNGHDPYPAAQYAAAVALTRALVARYQIPRSQLVRHLDISPGRKTDPDGFPWARFVDEVFGYAADSPILGAALGTEAAAVAWFATRTTHYTPTDVRAIVGAYRREGERGGVDWFLALAQSAHETGSWTSAFSARPVRNPAGIGVTGEAVDGPPPVPGQSILDAPAIGFAWDADRSAWRRVIAFARWDADAVRAHLGRLLAYALPAGAGSAEQQAMIAEALAYRALPAELRGVARTISDLDGRWAVPGVGYGARIALLAERIRGAT